MRLLFLSTRMPIGGPSKVTVGLAEELSRRGHDAFLAAGDPEPGEAPDPRGVSTALPVHRLPALVRPLSPLRDLRSLLAIRWLLRTERPDVLFTSGSKAGALGRLAALTVPGRPRTVHVFHGHVFRGHFSRRAAWLFATIERLLARVTDDAIAICESVRADLEELGLGRTSRLHLVYIGCDELEPLLGLGEPQGALAREVGAPPEAAIAIHPARICHVKAQDLMIDAVAAVKERLPAERFRLLFVGDGESRASLEARAAGAGVSDRVHFLGYREEMAPLFRDASLTVLSSRSEGTPVGLLESAAAGCPILATAVGGVPEIVGDSLGRLVTAGDAKKLGEALAELCEGGAPRRIASEARNTIVERFSMGRFADDVERILSAEGGR